MLHLLYALDLLSAQKIVRSPGSCHLAKIKVCVELHSFLEALGKNLFPYLLQFLKLAHIPWLLAPSSKPEMLL